MTTPNTPASAEELVDLLYQAIARGWSYPENSHKVMDVELGTAIAKEIIPVFTAALDAAHKEPSSVKRETSVVACENEHRAISESHATPAADGGTQTGASPINAAASLAGKLEMREQFSEAVSRLVARLTVTCPCGARELEELQATLRNAPLSTSDTETLERLLSERESLGRESQEAIVQAAMEKAYQRGVAEHSVPPEFWDELRTLLSHVSQVFDGWHADGTAWSEWDESVRQRVSKLATDIDYATT